MIPGVTAGQHRVAAVAAAAGWYTAGVAAAVTFTENGKLAEQVATEGGGYTLLRATYAAAAGKRYCEFEVLRAADGFMPGLGLCSPTGYTDNVGGHSELGAFSHSLRANANTYIVGTLTAFPYSVVDGDVVRMAVDFDAGLVWWGVNASFSGDPAAGTGAASTTLRTAGSYPMGANGVLGYPAASSYIPAGDAAATGTKTRIRLLSTEWLHAAPTNFVAFDAQ